MNFKKRINKPRSNRTLLVDQVEEQSDICDINIKVQNWERKFHRCVLVLSPFFELAMKHNFLESQTGILKIEIGSPDAVEMAIMYLYGKKPRLNMENVSTIVEMAEYFMLPKLKAYCINWLKTATFTIENCVNVLILSSLYNFEIRKCTFFIESNLPAIFESEMSVYLTRDSVAYIMSERIFSYVPMNAKLKFLLKWLEKCQVRFIYAEEMCKLIKFEDISISLLTEVKQVTVMKSLTWLHQESGSDTEGEDVQEVFTIQNRKRYGSLWCLDLKREEWYRLESMSLLRTKKGTFFSMSVKSSSPSETYFYDSEDGLGCINLATETTRTYSIPLQNDNPFFEHNIVISENICMFYTYDDVQVTVAGRRLTTSLRTSTLHAGCISDDDRVVDVHPLFTLPDGHISAIHINCLSVVLIDLYSDFVILYDIRNYQVEKIQLPVKDGSYHSIFPTDDGFVILDNTNVFLLRKITSDTNTLKHRLCEIKFEHQWHYFFSGKRWFRYLGSGTNFKFECASHEDVISSLSLEDVTWKSLPIPPDFEESMIHDRLEITELPKSKLRCHFNCPHCEFMRSIYLRTSDRYYEETYYNDDTSDDENYDGPLYYKMPGGQMMIYLESTQSDHDLTEQTIPDFYDTSCDYYCNTDDDW